jgi:hypothetical protein
VLCFLLCLSSSCVVFLVLYIFVLRLVYPILTISLDREFLVAPKIFSNVYLYFMALEWPSRS